MTTNPDPTARLALIADLLVECPPPRVADGDDRCPCRTGETWPCPSTQASWLSRGLDPDAQVRAVITDAEAELAHRDAHDPTGTRWRW